MIIRVADLISKIGNRERHQIREELSPLPFDGEDYPLSGPAEIEANLLWTGKEIDARVRVQAEVTVPCGRCLEPGKLGLEVEFSEAFRPGREPANQDEDDTDDKIVNYFEGDSIDLAPSVVDNLILAMPMKPLCRPECRGICPKCGQDLNLGRCNCPVEIGDPRLAVLADLLKPKPNKPS